MVTVKCILPYYDTKFNRHVELGEEFKVDDDRAEKLVKARVASVITTTTPTTEKVVKAKKPRVKKEA